MISVCMLDKNEPLQSKHGCSGLIKHKFMSWKLEHLDAANFLVPFHIISIIMNKIMSKNTSFLPGNIYLFIYLLWSLYLTI